MVNNEKLIQSLKEQERHERNPLVAKKLRSQIDQLIREQSKYEKMKAK